MSYELISQEKSIGQFASNQGYAELIQFCNSRSYPALSQFFEAGQTKDIDEVRKELHDVVIKAKFSVSKTAFTLMGMLQDLTEATISDGVS